MSLLRDLRYGARTLRKSPGLMVVATLALGLGIGLTATMWSIIYGALIKGVPFPEPDRVVSIMMTNTTRPNNRQPVNLADYLEITTTQKSFSIIGGHTCGTINVSGLDKPERYDGCWVTATDLALTRVPPLLGRLIEKGEDRPGGERVAVVSYNLWQSKFGGRPDAVGSVLRANGQPYTVIGVMPDGFKYPDDTQIWIPFQDDMLATKRGEGRYLQVNGRLNAGVSIDAANVEFNAISSRIASAHPETNEHLRAGVEPFVRGYIGPQPVRLLYTMLGAVGFVLLIACANVANLLLDRAAHRTKEIGIRTALGASRMAVVRQFLAEAVILSGMAAVIGTAIAWAGADAFSRAIASETQPPFFIDIRLHPPVLLFIIGVALFASFISGILPALQASRSDINEILKDESRGASSLHIGKLSRALVVVEIALSCGLLVAAGLMTKSVTKLRNIDPGFELGGVFTARVGFPIGSDTVKQLRFFEQLPQRLAQIPGAQAASVSTGLPGVSMWRRSITPEGNTYTRDQDRPTAYTLAVTPSFFDVYGMKLRQGRALTDADNNRNAAPVAVVTQQFVKTFFNGADPIGHTFRFAGGDDSTKVWSIVGVVPDVFSGDNEKPWAEAVFTPFAHQRTAFASIAVKMPGDNPMAVTSQVRDAVASLDADTPIYFVYSMREAFERPTWFVRVFGTMFMIFGGVALFLAAIGLYAVMAFSVSRRMREVGIRMALGARSLDVIRLIFGQGIWQLGVGLTIGLAMAAGVSQLLGIILFDVQPRDPTIFGGVVTVLSAAGLLACYVPARRATAVDPNIALRSD
jgi:predicted permease